MQPIPITATCFPTTPDKARLASIRSTAVVATQLSSKTQSRRNLRERAKITVFLGKRRKSPKFLGMSLKTWFSDCFVSVRPFLPKTYLRMCVFHCWSVFGQEWQKHFEPTPHFAGSLRELGPICGNFAGIWPNLREFCGNFAGICGKFINHIASKSKH